MLTSVRPNIKKKFQVIFVWAIGAKSRGYAGGRKPFNAAK